MKKQSKTFLPALRRKNRQERNEFKVLNRPPRRRKDVYMNDVVNFLFNASARERAVIGRMFYQTGRATV